MPDCRWPFDYAERRLDGNELVEGNDTGSRMAIVWLFLPPLWLVATRAVSA